MRTYTSIAAAGLALLAFQALAADQLIQGRTLVVKDPTAGALTTKRNVLAVALEKSSAATLQGDPTLPGSAGGAILHLVANGANSTAQTFSLPQGTSPTTGRPYWSLVGSSGYKYRDAKGDQGAVKTLLVKRSPSGTFLIKAIIAGKNGPVDVVPPDPGTDGYLELTLGSGDRYCVKYGSDGKVKNSGPRLFKVSKPVAEGCSASPSGAFLDLTD
jgi:hypothetical protein